MGYVGITGLLLVIVTVGISYRGFSNAAFFEQYKFEIDAILVRKEYSRLIASGFLHVSWMHLIFNMLSLYAFSDSIEYIFGSFQFLIIYFASLIGGNLLALFIHRHHPDYSAVGASGAVSGIIFSSIALFPDGHVGLIFLPVSLPGWMFGVGYILFTIYGIKSKRDNIGHEAHLGGALIGMLVTMLLKPVVFFDHYIVVSIIALPALVFIYIIITRPHVLLVDNFFFKTHNRNEDIDHIYNERKNIHQQEIDRILDKIGREGINSLSKKEKDQLEEYSRK